uniref:Secreted protein n=1 Tax=Bursaphelenchus xylophilus TaxID=6326 RepID=A0A1I7RJJ7_BURXY
MSMLNGATALNMLLLVVYLSSPPIKFVIVKISECESSSKSSTTNDTNVDCTMNKPKQQCDRLEAVPFEEQLSSCPVPMEERTAEWRQFLVAALKLRQ